MYHVFILLLMLFGNKKKTQKKQKVRNEEISQMDSISERPQ
jgi:hypothetical protein